MIEFKLKEDQEFITLVNLLKINSVISSGGEIKHYLNEELVAIEGVVLFEKRKKIYANMIVDIDGSESIKVVR